MDKLEHYLDLVCRGIGGPRSLRQHIRQELREHLRDAVAEHRVAGMSEEEALARALEDFGGPEEVRSELEATHGHRLMTVVIDKAMQWKEKTMKARWLWTTWAHLALAGVIALEVLFVTFAAVFIVPKTRMFLREGWYEIDRGEPTIAWVPGFLGFMDWVANNTTWLLLAAMVLLALFEWRVRNENKMQIRLGVLGTAAFGLMVLVSLTAAALVLPMIVGLQDMYAQIPERAVLEKESRINASVASLEEAMATKDWDAIRSRLGKTENAMNQLGNWGAAGSALSVQREEQRANEVRTQLLAARSALIEARQAAWNKKEDQLESAMKKFHEAFGQLQSAAKPPK